MRVTDLDVTDTNGTTLMRTDTSAFEDSSSSRVSHLTPTNRNGPRPNDGLFINLGFVV